MSDQVFVTPASQDSEPTKPTMMVQHNSRLIKMTPACDIHQPASSFVYKDAIGQYGSVLTLI